MVTLAPLVPLGTHSALGTVSQHKIMTAIRACEVAADPPNALALEAAVRRPPRRHEAVRLAAIQRWSAHSDFRRLVRALQPVRHGHRRPRSGNCRFEQAALAEHLRFAVAGLARRGPAAGSGGADAAIRGGRADSGRGAAELAAVPADIVIDHDRAAGRGYYRDVCFKVNALVNGASAEIGDGGFTDWTAKLLASNKERLLISGYGLDRLAMLIAPENSQLTQHPTPEPRSSATFPHLRTLLRPESTVLGVRK